MPSLFSRIITGDIPSYKIAEDDRFYAFLDINPMSKGHTLVVPKAEIDYIFDLDDTLLTEMTLFSKKIAKAIKEVIPCDRVGVMVVGLDVPHAHIHLIPINTAMDMSLTNPRLQLSKDEFSEVAAKVAAKVVL